MNPQRRRNLNRSDWIEVAIDLLAREGIGAISIDALANRLQITRGSFYHHFENRRDLLSAVLDYWLEAWTLDVRNSVSDLGLDAETSLMALVNSIRNRGAANYDAAIRAWAFSDKLAAEYVTKADKIRLKYIASLFRQAGFKGDDLETRARLYLYYEAFEPMMFDRSDLETEKRLVKIRHALLTNTEVVA